MFSLPSRRVPSSAPTAVFCFVDSATTLDRHGPAVGGFLVDITDVQSTLIFGLSLNVLAIKTSSNKSIVFVMKLCRANYAAGEQEPAVAPKRES